MLLVALGAAVVAAAVAPPTPRFGATPSALWKAGRSCPVLSLASVRHAVGAGVLSGMSADGRCTFRGAKGVLLVSVAAGTSAAGTAGGRCSCVCIGLRDPADCAGTRDGQTPAGGFVVGAPGETWGGDERVRRGRLPASAAYGSEGSGGCWPGWATWWPCTLRNCKRRVTDDPTRPAGSPDRSALVLATIA